MRTRDFDAVLTVRVIRDSTTQKAAIPAGDRGALRRLPI
jgi:hypothetical protein